MEIPQSSENEREMEISQSAENEREMEISQSSGNERRTKFMIMSEHDKTGNEKVNRDYRGLQKRDSRKTDGGHSRVYVLAAITVCLWGTLPSTSKMLIMQLSEIEMLFWVSIAATAFLFVVTLATGQIREIRDYHWKDILVILGLGVLGTYAYNAFYNVGLARLSSQEACVINYLWPIMIVIFSIFVLGEKMTLRKVIAILLSFFGIVLLVTKLDFRNLKLDSPMGVMTCVLAAVCYGLFCALNKKKSYNQYISLMLYYLITAVITGLQLAIKGDIVGIHGTSAWVNLIWVGVVANGFAYLCWCLALVGGDTTKVANIAYITPFMAIVFSRIILKEKISIYALLGLIFIILGIVVQLTKGKQRKSET